MKYMNSTGNEVLVSGNGFSAAYTGRPLYVISGLVRAKLRRTLWFRSSSVTTLHTGEGKKKKTPPFFHATGEVVENFDS